MKTIEDNWHGCKIVLLNPDGAPSLYSVTHNKSNEVIHCIAFVECFKIARLLELEHLVCSWFNKVKF